jgi:hypothetical protein
MLRAADRMCRVRRDDLAGDQPIEQHADCGEMLFHRRFLEPALHRLDIGSDVQRLDIGNAAELVLIAPGEESGDGPVIGHAGVFVADGGSEEFQEAPCRLVAGIGDDRGTMISAAMAREIRSGLSAGANTDGQLAAGFRFALGHGFSVT